MLHGDPCVDTHPHGHQTITQQWPNGRQGSAEVTQTLPFSDPPPPHPGLKPATRAMGAYLGALEIERGTPYH